MLKVTQLLSGREKTEVELSYKKIQIYLCIKSCVTFRHATAQSLSFLTY